MIPICWHAPCTIWPPTALELPGPQAVTVEMAARVLGPAGVVNAPLALWAQWANPMFSRAGAPALEQPAARYPKVEALVRSLEGQGLVRRTAERVV